jgi:hypothetical protein
MSGPERPKSRNLSCTRPDETASAVTDSNENWQNGLLPRRGAMRQPSSRERYFAIVRSFGLSISNTSGEKIRIKATIAKFVRSTPINGAFRRKRSRHGSISFSEGTALSNEDSSDVAKNLFRDSFYTCCRHIETEESITPGKGCKTSANGRGRVTVVVVFLGLVILSWLEVNRFFLKETLSFSLSSVFSISNPTLDNSSDSLRNRSGSELVEHMSAGIIARAFPMWDKPLPCFAPEEKKFFAKAVSLPNVHKGFMFMKLMKTGGSTAAGVNIRIMEHAAKQVQMQESGNNFRFCQGRFEHAWGHDMLANHQRDGASFTWTMVRDPTNRAISQFFHFQVSRQKLVPSDYLFQQHLWSEKIHLSNYYLNVLNDEIATISDTNAPAIINKILLGYNFIGVTERMDETLVALMMLLKVAMSTILYLKAKASGGYDDGGTGTCVYIQPSHLSTGMKAFFEHTRWKKVVKWDEMFYKAANRSLDLTIERLGQAEFYQNLAKFQHALKTAQDRCLPRDVFPCSSKGIKNPKKSCLWKDSGCGSDCLDEVATELTLL